MKRSWWSAHHVELIGIGIWLAAATFFRTYHLLAIPPGLHYDEAIDLRQALNILDGARPLYVVEGWGREALFYYLVAGLLKLVPYNPLALRLTTTLCSLVTIGVVYLWVRKVWNWQMAWFAAAWLSLTFWTVSTSRVGVRNITLPLTFSLTVLCFWYAWTFPRSQHPLNHTGFFTPGWHGYVLSGFCLGLTLYTYQPARFTPFIFATFVLYLALFHRPILQEKWRGLSLMAVVAILTVLPLILILYQNRGAEVARDWTIEPLTELLAGNVQPIVENFWLTLKMFTFRGDPLIAYNLPERPVFVPTWTGLFFYVGLLICLWRWRQPPYAFLLIWLPIALSPTILTISAPHFNRTIAAQIPVMVMSALPLAEVPRWITSGAWPLAAGKKPTASGQWLAVTLSLCLLALIATGYATWRDYFQVWPQEPLLTVQYNRYLLAMAQALSQNPDAEPLMNSRNLEDADPYILTASLGEELHGRWLDSGHALAFPAGQEQIELWVAQERYLDQTLAAWAGAEVVEQQPYFTRYALHPPPWPPADGTPLAYLPPTVTWLVDPAKDAPSLNLPITFAGQVALTARQFPATAAHPGESFTFLTFWQVLQNGQPQSLAFFVHLLDAQGNIISQQDGMGFPPHTWRAGDRFVHIHSLALDMALPSGTYWIQLGIYQREDGQRWPIEDITGQAVGDRLLLTKLMIAD